MATYKLIQDIEAEDHVLGPLSLRQFIFALMAVFGMYMCFVAITKQLWPLLVIFAPVALFFSFFAFPFGKDQPTEIWALARIRFLFKPRRRIWDQSGIKELVTVTAPVKEEPVLTDGLDQTQVHSRLKALAKTLDSRGWAVRGADDATFYNEMPAPESDDRLVGLSSLPVEEPVYDAKASDDVLDEDNSPVAQKFSAMIDQAEQSRRQEIVEKMNQAPEERQESQVPKTQEQPDFWFINPEQAVTDAAAAQPSAMQAADETSDDLAMAEQLKAAKQASQEADAQLKTIKTLADSVPQVPPVYPAAPPTTDPAILSLASNNDLNVATLAREANKVNSKNEVVISLH